MKIKMKTTSCGPDPTFNFNKGQVRDVTVEEARYWHSAGVCELIDLYPADAEKAVLKAPEKAVVKPAETAKAVVTPEPTKLPVAQPASSTTVASAKAATWGTPEVKA